MQQCLFRIDARLYNVICRREEKHVTIDMFIAIMTFQVLKTAACSIEKQVMKLLYRKSRFVSHCYLFPNMAYSEDRPCLAL